MSRNVSVIAAAVVAVMRLLFHPARLNTIP